MHLRNCLCKATLLPTTTTPVATKKMADPPSTAGEASDGQVASIEEDFPQTVFESYSEAHKALEAHAFSAGYSVVVAERWPRGGKEHTRVTFRCGKGRQWVEKQHLAHQTKRRKTSTQMTGGNNASPRALPLHYPRCVWFALQAHVIRAPP